MRVDTFGRTFKNLIPRSPHVLSKVKNDWRLQNAMSLLAEVGPDNGGRLLSRKLHCLLFYCLIVYILFLQS